MSDGEELDIDVESTDNLPLIKIERTDPPPQEIATLPQFLPQKIPDFSQKIPDFSQKIPDLSQNVPDLLPQIKVEIKEAAEFLAESLCSMVGLQLHGGDIQNSNNVWFKPSFMYVYSMINHSFVLPVVHWVICKLAI